MRYSQMEITIISELDDSLQVWTLNLTEEEMFEFCEKYGHRGCSVLTSSAELTEELRDIYK